MPDLDRPASARPPSGAGPEATVDPPCLESALPPRLPAWAEGLEIAAEELEEEVLVFDPRRQLAFRLDGPTALVFRACGAREEVAAVCRALGGRGRCGGEALLLAALEELHRRGLVRAAPLLASTRRSVLGHLARGAVALPAILSVAVPSPAAAMSHSLAWSPSLASAASDDREEKRWTEQYDPIHENPFRDTLVHPVSTFSVDVDTASYSNVRRFLRLHELPPRDAVRSEEIVNYFSYDGYPQPSGGEPLALWSGLAACPWKSEHQLLHLGLRARQPEAGQPSNLVFLIDVSGSMFAPDKLALLKSSLRLLIDRLTGLDRVALVAYAGASGLVLPSTPGDEKEAILEALDALQAGGSTAGGAGIELAYSVARRHFIPGGVNRVLLATDGDFNVGVTSRGELGRLIEERGKEGVYLTILGFGTGNLKAATLEQLAQRGDGQFAYIDSLAEAQKVLVEGAGGALVTVAKDVKIQVEFNPVEVAAYRLIGYENRLLDREDFLDDGRDAGDVGAGHTVTALFELIPQDGGASRTRP
ncbi:MAG: von Willebrand factor type A domain-containing protein, partial [Acidobacteriota bacterium]